MKGMLRFFAAALSAAFVQIVSAEPSLQSGSVIEAAERLKPGEFLWATEVTPQGPVLWFSRSRGHAD